VLTSTTSVITVLVASDVRIYREGVAEALTAVAGIEAMSTVTAEALATVAAAPPDVVVCDVAAEGGMAIVRALSRCPTRVVVLGVDQLQEEVVPWAEAGASGFVGRDASLVGLAAAVEDAARGELSCSPSIARALCDRVAALATAARPADADALTRRERDILALVEVGLTNKEIAARLCIESATVKNHVHSILTKLGVRRRGDAAARLRTLYPELTFRQVDLPSS
jgi:DNA-binding NarL/FixJ family response regulator